MQSEFVFTVRAGHAERSRPISLADAGLRERDDLQEWVRLHPEVLGADVRIVTFEFNAWRSRAGAELDRLDLLGIDSSGRLLVAELKRGTAPDTVEMQAIKYAAFASRFTPETLAQEHARYLSKTTAAPVSEEEARIALEEHVGGEIDIELLRRPRITLMAAGFPPQLTASAVWLTEMGIDISLVQFAAYQAEHDIILTVSAIWPPVDVEEFTVSPRQVDTRVADERSERRRESTAVTRLITDGTLADGTTLTIDPRALGPRYTDAVAAWIAEDVRRGRATWANDPGSPLIWDLDGDTYSPGGLAKEIIGRAGGDRPHAIAGPRVWVDESGESLSSLAGFGRGRRRDWAALHAALGTVTAGEWTTYGDLAEVIGSAAQPVGQHVTVCDECPHAYRVLTVQGEVAKNFAWGDPDEERSAMDVLTEEGLPFDGGRADPSVRVDAQELRTRVRNHTSA